MSTGMLIYDGACAYCRGFARVLVCLDRAGRIETHPFDAPDAQALLRAQFSASAGLAMYLVESDQIHWGARAAERVVEVLDWPRPLSRASFRLYPWLWRAVSRLSGHERDRPVCGPACAAPTAGTGEAGSLPLTAPAAVQRERMLDDRSP